MRMKYAFFKKPNSGASSPFDYLENLFLDQINAPAISDYLENLFLDQVNDPAISPMQMLATPNPSDDTILDKCAAIEEPRSTEKTAKASLWRLDVWQDVKKHVVTNPSDMSAANNSTVDQDLSNTAVEHKCSANGGNFYENQMRKIKKGHDGHKNEKVGEDGQVDILSHKVRLLEAYSWGQKVVGGIEAAWGVKKTENETENGWEHFLGIKRWSVVMRLRQVQRRGKMKPRRVRD
ncbi:hypothetical protein Tco_0351264 [Tanacetum coccineum]